MTGDFRTSGEHDCDRLLYSSAYRRLTGVTQVVAVGERQLFHNRLTHTQKVAQLSRRLAQSLNHRHGDLEAIDVDAAEAAGHAHDLGHPPFGHIAEAELNRLCERDGIDGYEGNAQSFRIVTKLAVRRNERGLQLSARTLNGILKYPWLSSSRPAHLPNKWGAYLTEAPDFEKARLDLSASAFEKTIEAEVMDWADDISYAVHDFEDFFRAGLIDTARIRNSRAIRIEFLAQAMKEFHDHQPLEFEEAKDAYDRLDKQIPWENYAGTVGDRKNLNRFGAAAIALYVQGVKRSDSGALQIPRELLVEVHLLKQLTWQQVINEPSLATLQHGQVRVIRELYEGLTEWAASEKRRQRLPTRMRDLLRWADYEYTSRPDHAISRAVADYISSLTEDQALDMHARLHGRTVASIQDSWVAY